MEKITLTVKDDSKLDYLLKFLKQLDFVEVQQHKPKKPSSKKYDFFAYAGMWKNRKIDARELRENAWKRNG